MKQTATHIIPAIIYSSEIRQTAITVTITIDFK